MKIQLKWLLTGNVTPLAEPDTLLNPSTSILEVKGLISLSFGFPVKEILLVHKHVLENHSRLRDIGITDQGSADATILTAHVVRSDAMEPSNAAVDAEAEEEDDDGLQEFSHEDMITALRMLGKDVPVGEDRLAELRQNAPRAAPQFLSQRAQAPVASPKAPKQEVTEPTGGQPESSGPTRAAEVQEPEGSRTWRRLVTVFQKLQHGLRREGVDAALSIKVPGVAEPYSYWDLRLPHDMSLQNSCGTGEIVLEVYFFGEYEPLEKSKFHQQVVALLEREGVRAKALGNIREAGCMYPLVGVPILMSVVDAWALGDRVFEGFGSVSLHDTDHSSQPARAPGVYDSGLEGANAIGGQRKKEDCSAM